ncbi:hypothetical protein GCM10007094_33620 [Pseudovibrio japonicus]|uniref:Uncharacterized protein n=1 Tax=Pseudovibrio japonicus TaxID=366534 RepID=A0ABQ3EIZ6_9HYPH|nr:hypothetical protein [Pseudovibrio japonicus]GHB41458.1 hypothetical protein GCM10007094_33620 [Pseudovibrio japonicus]
MSAIDFVRIAIVSIYSGGGTYSLSNYSLSKYVGNASSSLSTRMSESLVPQDEEPATDDTQTTPDLEPTPDTVIDARDQLDDLYGELGTAADDYKDDMETFRTEVFDKLGFTRETLHMIARNEHGYFSEQEVEAAKQSMDEQLDEALGKNDPDYAPTAENYLSLLQYLNEETFEDERGTFEWAISKASAQVHYKRLADGEESDLFSDDPVVDLLTEAYEELFEAQKTDADAKLESMPSYDSAQYRWDSNNDTSDSDTYTAPDSWWR